MESTVEIILIGSINKLLKAIGSSIAYNCINIYKDNCGTLYAVSHNYDELIKYMETSVEFPDREYILKKVNKEEENKYLVLFDMTDEETLSSIIFEELKNLPTTKYPRKE